MGTNLVKKHVSCAGWTAAVMVAGLGVAPSAHAEGAHVVRPDESIQEAVDAAKPGDTVVLLPGVYRQSVHITTPGLTLRGTGEKTVLTPPGRRAADSCGKEGNGICVTGTRGDRLTGVTLQSLTVASFKKNGIWATGTDRFTVQDVTARDNGQWGIAQEKSTRGVFRHNTAHGNGDAGLFLANTIDEEAGALDTRGAVIRGNRVTDNRIGITVRRVRQLTVDTNKVTGNCAGVFVVGDESRPRAGAMDVHRNDVSANNKYCAATPRLPFLQGSGIVLTGAEETDVRGNRVQGNAGGSPLSGGIVLFRSFVGAKNERNVVRDNVVHDNKPADLANRDTGAGNRFTGNTCRTSEPSGLC